MNPARIEGATRIFNKPANWDEMSDQHCSALAIRDVVDQEGLPYMVSAWTPTPAELKKLIEGETLKLWIQGHNHPVVAMTVGDIS